MTATQKFLSLSEWVRDVEGLEDGPVEAQAFLVELMTKLGSDTGNRELAGKGHKRAGT